MDVARYAELFRIEAREHLAELDSALLALEQSVAGEHDDAHVATLFRGMHTIKGMAAAMGYDAVERLAHATESVLERWRGGAIARTPELVALLFDATDALSAAVSHATDGAGDRQHTTTADVLDRLARASSDGAATASLATTALDTAPDATPADADIAPASGPAPMAVDVRLRADCPLKGVRAMLVLARLQACGTVRRMEPAQPRWQDDDFVGAFTVVLSTDLSASEIEAAAHAAGDVERVLVREHAPVREPESVSSSAGAGDGRHHAAPDGTRYVRIDQRRLDTLVDLMGELVITRDRLLRQAELSVERGADRALLRDARETARLVSALQEEVLQARMVPVAQTFDRFPRLVRDIARDLGKDVHFVMEGRDIELDRSLLDAIGDPILHLLRNALDHGVEEAAVRRSLGKPPTSRLVLRAVRDRGAVVIQVEDDGRGIDRAAVRRRAIERGLIAAEERGRATGDHAILDDEQLLQTLAHPGLSTAREVTAISGRGVGVDVVSTRVRALGGFLALETIEGEGTVFTMRLPTTLAIMRALLVQTGSETYALPAAHVVEVLEYDETMRVERQGREGLSLHDELIPLLRLGERFGASDAAHPGYVAIVEAGERRSALLVDALVAQQDIVVKRFDAPRDGGAWFSGATVLGDGTPSLIVDVGSLT